MNSADEVLAAYDALRADQEALYKDLHRHLELSHQEHRTAERVAGRLQKGRSGSPIRTPTAPPRRPAASGT
jgi:metal-dependent amidase/aminoacylase/carboxypeptidase family protein